VISRKGEPDEIKQLSSGTETLKYHLGVSSSPRGTVTVFITGGKVRVILCDASVVEAPCRLGYRPTYDEIIARLGEPDDSASGPSGRTSTLFYKRYNVVFNLDDERCYDWLVAGDEWWGR